MPLPLPHPLTISLVGIGLHIVVLSLFHHHWGTGLGLKQVPLSGGMDVGEGQQLHVLTVHGGADVEPAVVIREDGEGVERGQRWHKEPTPPLVEVFELIELPRVSVVSVGPLLGGGVIAARLGQVLVYEPHIASDPHLSQEATPTCRAQRYSTCVFILMTC